MPVSADATNPVVRASVGTAEYAPEQEALVWKIKQLPGGKEYLLRAKFSLPSVSADDADGAAGPRVKRPPIQVQFELPYYTVSGIQARRRTPQSLCARAAAARRRPGKGGAASCTDSSRPYEPVLRRCAT